MQSSEVDVAGVEPSVPSWHDHGSLETSLSIDNASQGQTQAILKYECYPPSTISVVNSSYSPFVTCLITGTSAIF